MDQLTKLQEERLSLHAQMKTLHSERQDDWTADDEAKWSELETRYDEVCEEQQSLQAKADRAAKLSSLNEKVEQEVTETRSEIAKDRQERTRKATEADRALGMQAWLRRAHGRELLPGHKRAMELTGWDKCGDVEFSANVFGRSKRHGHGVWSSGNATSRIAINQDVEHRAELAVATEPEIIPEGFMYELSKALLAHGGLRQVCRILVTATGNPMPWPTWNDTGNSGALLAEDTTFGSSVVPTIAAITFNAYKFSSTPCVVSAELLEDSAFNLASELGEALGIRIARGLAGYLTTGTGSSQPQGITVGASTGVTAASATAIDPDELIDLQQSLDPAWEMSNNVGWVMKKAVQGVVRKMKDADGQYLWQPGMQAGVPDQLLGRPVAIVQEMPAATTGLKPIAYGDLSQFVIRDAGQMRFYRLNELYRDTDQTGFIGFSRHESKVLQTNAIKVLVMA